MTDKEQPIDTACFSKGPCGMGLPDRPDLTGQPHLINEQEPPKAQIDSSVLGRGPVDLKLPKELDDLFGEFADHILQKRTQVCLELIAAGYTPDDTTLCEKYWYDEEKMMLCYECWPKPREDAA